ncbi:Mrp family chromosome partitioning ATPase [Thermodesulfitimonas autotrophica]|uniref:Iron-sulfur cluster carrier protein n=1 Tax=Thermodesulfitimonas autotrophica TaxID=1894989 RepID=A0A3N5ACB7_9THEO|nr:Mrp/NBP35 family ATP-binding protein [Thermodesulfitimonas autotrophica]RPF42506.1 Mrp family chromosome partitioning ATPase [Thermodesulfitimonas autotrophica]
MSGETKSGQTGEACAACDGREAGKGKPKFEYLQQNELSNVKRVVAVMSGKGGVGKSLVTSLLAVTFTRDGYQVGILDADVTGPSIPKSFGVKGRPEVVGEVLYPLRTACGIRVISMNLFLEKEDEPVIWRGPVISGAIKQFWTDVAWGDLDYLFVDLPPGTGDVPLTVMQSLPLSGIIVVSSPQDLTIMVVRKAIRMAEMMGVPLLGLVENMAYIVCPQCGEKIYAFGAPQGKTVAAETGLELLATLPVDPKLAKLVDAGEIEECDQSGLEHLPRILDAKLDGKSLS